MPATKGKLQKDEAIVDKTIAQKILRSVSYEKGFHFFTEIGKENWGNSNQFVWFL